MGRPSDFTEEVAETICRRLADGDSLRTICEDDDMPSRESVRRWLKANEDFRGQYAQARDEQADSYADRAITEAMSATDAAIGRLRMDALKWAAGKLAPKRYGEKVTQEHTGPDGGPVVTRIENVIVDPSGSDS